MASVRLAAAVMRILKEGTATVGFYSLFNMMEPYCSEPQSSWSGCQTYPRLLILAASELYHQPVGTQAADMHATPS